MNDITQTAQTSSEWFQYYFGSYMLQMVALDIIIGLAILIAHRWFVLNERRMNEESAQSLARIASKPEPVRLARPSLAPASLAQAVPVG